MAESSVQGTHTEFTGSAKSLLDAVRAGKAGVQELSQFVEQKYAASISQAEKQQDRWNRSVAQLGKELKGGNATGELLRISHAVEALTKAGEAGSIKVDLLRSKIEAATKAGGTLPANLKQYATSINGLGAAVGNIKTEGLQRLSAQAGPLSGALGAIGPAGIAAAAGIGAMVAAGTGVAKLVTDAANWGDKITDTATALGTSVEGVQRLEQASMAAGVSFDTTSAAVLKMQRAIADSPDKILDLGLSLEQLKNLAPEEQFRKVGEALMLIEDPAQRNAAAIGVLGKSWAELAPLIDGGLDAMDSAKVMSAEQVKALDDLKKELTLLDAEWNRFWLSVGASISNGARAADVVRDLRDAFRGIADAIRGLPALPSWMVEGIKMSTGLNVLSTFAARGRQARESEQAPDLPYFRQREQMERAASEEAIRKQQAQRAREAQAREDEARRREVEQARRERERRQREAARELYERTFLHPVTGKMLNPAQHQAPGLMADWDTLRGKIYDLLAPARDAAARQEQRLVPGLMTSWNTKRGEEDAERREYEAWADRMIQKQETWLALADALPGIFSEVSGILAGMGVSDKLTGIIQDLGDIGGNMANTTKAAMSGDIGGTIMGVLGGMRQAFGLGKEHLSGANKGLLGLLAAANPIMAGPAALGALFGAKESEKALQATLERMERATGLEAVDEFNDKMRKGGMTAKEMSESFDAAFNEIMPHALSKTTGLLSDAGEQMIKLAKNSGIASDAVKQLMAQQAQALAQNLAGGVASMATSREKGGPGLASQAAATGIGASFAASFDLLVKQGMSVNEALKQLAPSVEAFRAELMAAGFEGGAAFDALEQRVAILTGEVTGPLVEGIGSFTMALANMSNLGILTEDVFAGITEQIGANIKALEEQGVTGPAAIAALQPSLQTVWELQQKYGFKVDETTQALIDEGIAAGQLGPKFKPSGEQMKDIMERVALAVERLATALAGAEGKASGLGRTLNGLPRNTTLNVTVNTKTNTDGSSDGEGSGDDSDGDGVPDDSDNFPDDPMQFRRGTAGTGSVLQNFGAGTPAMLHDWEAVLTEGQLKALTSNTFSMGALSQRGGSEGALLDELKGMRADLREHGARIAGAHRDTVLLLKER